MPTKDKYSAELLLEVQETKTADKKTPLQKRRLKRYDAVEIGGIEKLATGNEETTSTEYFLPAEGGQLMFFFCFILLYNNVS